MSSFQWTVLRGTRARAATCLKRNVVACRRAGGGNMAAPARMFGEGEDADVGGVGAEVGVVGAVPQEHCISN